jgi:hypothetical protein
MCNNLGKLDRALRILAGIVLLYMAIMDIYTPYTWIGVIPLLTGVLASCPLYGILGIKTKCSTKD